METRNNRDTAWCSPAWWRSGWWRRWSIYPVFLMKVLCFALFACAFNLLIGYVGLLSFGHAMFFGFAAYISGYTVKVLGWPTEVGILAGTARGRGSWGWWWAPSPSAARASTSPWSRWRWRRWCSSSACRPSSPAARTASRPSRAGRCSACSTSTNDFVFYYVVLAIFCIGFLII